MGKLSIFIDESGDFGEIKERPAYYLVTFVFHDQNKNIDKQVQKLEGSMRTAGFDVEYIHAGPVIRREEVFAGFGQITVYYDNGQSELSAIINAVFSIRFPNVEFRKAQPQKYRLLQAADTIRQNLEDFGREPKDYDKIITGDLGEVGQSLLFDLLSEKKIDITRQHMDCGIEIYESEKQHTDAGGSGCGCSAAVLSAYILKKIEEGIWKRVLFVPTGALLSKTSFNEGQTIPGIAHGVALEYIQK